MSIEYTKVELTDFELLQLSGIDRLSAIVEAARQRLLVAASLPSSLTESESAFVSKVVEYAQTNGWLGWRWSQVRKCDVCEETDGYHVHGRTNSRKGIRKGETNYDAPRYRSAVELAPSFTSIRGHVSLGCCYKCMDKLQPILADALVGIESALPADLIKVGEFRKKKYPNKHCNACGWDGHEGEMIRSQTLMGDGHYPAKCPRCEADNKPFGRNVVVDRDGYTLIAVPLRIERRDTSPMRNDNDWREINIERINKRPADFQYTGDDVVINASKYGIEWRETWKESP